MVVRVGYDNRDNTASLGGVVPSSGVPPVSSIPGANIRFLGHGHFLVTLDVIAQTGSAITTLLDLPFAHELSTILVKHVDANNVDNTDAETVNFKHRYGNLWFNIWSIVAGTAADTYGKFTDAYQLPGQYQIITNTTNGHKLYIQMEIYVMET